jgi:oligopeptide transport system ATP-binding protein
MTIRAVTRRRPEDLAAAPMLSVRDLEVTFGSGDRVVHAVNGVSYDLGAGETMGIVGESGSGKSVSSLAVLGLLPKPAARASGSIVFDGDELLGLDDDQMRKLRGNRLAMIFQDPMTSLNPVLTIERQLTEVLETHQKLKHAGAERRAIQLLEMVGIPGAEKRLNDFPHQFSGGMRQRVMIAIALACDPELLIADEPTTALDVTIQAQILDLMRSIVAEVNTALILITHDLGVVAGMCRTTAVMYAGRIIERAHTAELFGRPRHPYTVGLLRSLPRLDGTERGELVPIKGQPPDLSRQITGCPFAPRCFNVQDRCRAENPPLEQAPDAEDGHEVACFFPAEGEKLVPSGFAAQADR